MESSRQRTPRLDPKARREQILGATYRVVLEEGFVDLTVDQIAREAGITRPVVYDIFGDLDGLLEEFLDQAENRAFAAVVGALPPADSDGPASDLLGNAIETFLDAVKADPDVWRIVLLPPDGAPTGLRGRIERRRSELADRIAVIVGAVCERQGLLLGIDYHLLAKLLIGIGEDMGRLTLDQPRKFSAGRLAGEIGAVAGLLQTTGGRE